MTNRSVDDIPTIRVEDNDRVVQPRANRPPPPPASSQGASSVFTLILTLIAIGFSGYLYWLSVQQQASLDAASARIQELENKLSATGEEMGNSTVALQVKLTEVSNRTQELWEQMDKLWASAWRRNQKEIKELTAVVEDNRTAAQRSDNTITSKIDSTVTQNKVVSEALEQDLSSTRNELLAVNLEIENIKQSLLSNQNKNNTVDDKIRILEQRNDALRQKVSTLERTINAIRTGV